jgi:hypothetical protein
VLGESDYLHGGLERLEESGILLRNGRYAGSVYLAGRAVESMLRALIWKNDPQIKSGRKSLDTGHDLREMLANAIQLGVLSDCEYRMVIADGIQKIARLWLNNMRYYHSKKLTSIWWEKGVISRKRPLKLAAFEFFNACSIVFKRCEVLCLE